jgi:DNA repair exonuclease SbcCD ATPase subunit
LEEQQARSQRLAKQAADDRAAASAQRAIDAKAKAEAQARRQKQDDEANALREKQEEDARTLAEKRTATEKLQPDLDDAKSRLQSANEFWGGISQSLAAQGRGLRSEVQMKLRSANTTAQRCSVLSQNLDGDGLKACIADLTGMLGKLDEYK